MRLLRSVSPRLANQTLYAQAAGNRLKTVFFLGVYVALILAIGYGLAYYFNNGFILIIAGLISVVQGLVAYFASDKIALATAQAVTLDEVQYKPVYQMVENLAKTAGLPMPRLFLIPGEAINAFATGRDGKHAAVAITQGAMQKLTNTELEGVLAHELSHISNEDIRLTSMVMVMVGLIATAAGFFQNSLFFGGNRDERDNQGGGGGLILIIGIVLSVLAPIAATLIQLAISRSREYLADENGVLLTRYPEGLIGALKKIGQDEEPVGTASTATAHMYFANPLAGKMSNLFTTHPPLEQRIKRLEEGGGITNG